MPETQRRTGVAVVAPLFLTQNVRLAHGLVALGSLLALLLIIGRGAGSG